MGKFLKIREIMTFMTVMKLRGAILGDLPGPLPPQSAPLLNTDP